MEYFSKAHFIYDEESAHLIQEVEENKFGVIITSMKTEDFIDHIASIADDIEHIVISVSAEKIPEILAIAYQCEISIGIVPNAKQTEQLKNLYASTKTQENLEIALGKNTKTIDLVEINDDLIYSQGIVGTVPLMGDGLKKIRHSFFKTLLYSIKKFFFIELQKFEITTKNGQKIITAGSAIVILNHTKNGLISKMFNFNQSLRDGKITLVIISPYSVFEYIKLLFTIFQTSKEKQSLPKSIGYVQSESFSIKASSSKVIKFDNTKKTLLPIECKIVPAVVRLNASEKFWEHNPKISSKKETIKIANLPDEVESQKYTIPQHIPFFKSASEERFKELFQVLRLDSKVNFIYLVLMIISTLLATFGLFANSAAVIIGAMLVAPLMTPIVSVSMGLLRGDTKIIVDSLIKIAIGVGLALIASSLLTFILPSFEITSEMRARITPTLLDLAIAMLSGVAAAFSKSFKEIAQNLAGVAIAVALVPPLAVAGVGLGYLNMYAFLGAFLLFFTNLVGIIIAAVITFQLLGFSNVVRSKKSVAFIFVLLIGVSYPLYISYDDMIQKYQISEKIKAHRFLVNDKYIIVNNAEIVFHGKTKIINLRITVRESLNRDDFEVLKSDIQRLLNSELFIKTQVEYIL